MEHIYVVIYMAVLSRFHQSRSVRLYYQYLTFIFGCPWPCVNLPTFILIPFTLYSLLWTRNLQHSCNKIRKAIWTCFTAK